MKKIDFLTKKPKKKCFGIFDDFGLSKNYGLFPKSRFLKLSKKACFWGYLRTYPIFSWKKPDFLPVFWHVLQLFCRGNSGSLCHSKRISDFFRPIFEILQISKKITKFWFWAEKSRFLTFFQIFQFSHFLQKFENRQILKNRLNLLVFTKNGEIQQI